MSWQWLANETQTVREQLSETTRNVDKLGSWLLDHEKRLVALEAESKTRKR